MPSHINVPSPFEIYPTEKHDESGEPFIIFIPGNGTLPAHLRLDQGQRLTDGIAGLIAGKRSAVMIETMDGDVLVCGRAQDGFRFVNVDWKSDRGLVTHQSPAITAEILRSLQPGFEKAIAYLETGTKHGEEV